AKKTTEIPVKKSSSAPVKKSTRVTTTISNKKGKEEKNSSSSLQNDFADFQNNVKVLADDIKLQEVQKVSISTSLMKNLREEIDNYEKQFIKQFNGRVT